MFFSFALIYQDPFLIVTTDLFCLVDEVVIHFDTHNLPEAKSKGKNR